MKTILITGAGGYIGSHVAKQLLLDEYKVIAFDNFSRGFREPLSILKKYGGLSIVEGDITSKEDLQKVFNVYKIDAVMHFAALCSIDESMEKPELYFKNNVLGTKNLLEVMVEAEVDKIIFSSTCAVYGNAKYLPIDEEHPVNPENIYGESKLKAEKAIWEFSKSNKMHVVIFRFFNVCGADTEGEIGDSKKPSELLVQNAVRGALEIENFNLTCPRVDTPDGTPIRDYIDVLDVVDAHIKALDYLNQGGKNMIINLGNGRGWSVKEILEEVKKDLGNDFQIKASSYPRKGEYKEVYADIKKAQKILNWQPSRTLAESIQSLKKWYEKNPNGYNK